MIDSHQIAERARLLSHRIYADRLRAEPALVEAARWALPDSTSESVTVGADLWIRLLRADLGEIIRHMLDEGEEGRLLRATSPFSIVIGIDNLEDRKSLWRQAKADLFAKRTLTARYAA